MTDDYEWNGGGLYNTNYLTLTLDLSSYANVYDLTLAFDYIQLGDEEHSDDKVWVRGSNNDSWLEIYDWWPNRASTGTVKQVSDLDIDALLTANSQTVSSTFQIRFGQRDNSFIYGTAGSDGLILDNIQVEGYKTLTYVGSANGDWNTASNWSPSRVPTKDDNIYTEKNVRVNNDAEVHTISATANIVMNSEFNEIDFDIYGDFIGSGQINEYRVDEYCNVNLVGNEPQRIGGIHLYTADYPQVNINNSNGIVLTDDWDLESLNIISGTVELGDFDIDIRDDYLSGASAANHFIMSGTGKIKLGTLSNRTFHLYRDRYLPITLSHGNHVTIGMTEVVYENPASSINAQTTNIVTNTWTIETGFDKDDVEITVGWEESEEASGFSRSNCNLAYWQDGASTAWNVATASAASGSGPYTQTRTLDFVGGDTYYFAVGDNSSALPVELTHFTAQWQNQNKNTLLTWQTATETNNSHFLIERSFDGVEFQTIGQVEGMGTTITSSEYQFTDPLETRNSKLETIYYRLKQVDFNGDYDYSDVNTLSSELETRSSFSVWPNPSSGDFINLSEIGDYKLFDLNGIELKSISNTNRLDVSLLPFGSYIIRNGKGTSVMYVRS